MNTDQSARDVARKCLDANIVVEAGAGTGKTTLLTDRLMFLLLAGGPDRSGLSVTRIVALTFTEKAAGEIKVRLAERLNDLLIRLDGRPLPDKRRELVDFWVREARTDFAADPDRLRTMARDALRDLDRAPIGTLHGFCRTLLQLYPIESGLNPGAQVDKGDAFEALFQDEWGQWLETELVQNGANAPAWEEILTHVGLGDLRALARDSASRELPEADGQRERARLETLRAAIERLPLGKPVPRRGKMLESLARVAERLRGLEAVARNPDGPFPTPDDWAEKPKDWPREWATEEGEPAYAEACAVLKATSPSAEAAVARARRLLAPFVRRCRDRYRAAGWIGFDDLLREARRLLADHLDVRRELKARYGAILVDEFQDTDPLQGETLLFLAEGPESQAGSWRDVVLDPGRLFIVGDPKQSIYRFRGADIRAYESFVALVLAQGGRRCDLQRSFRTHENIVEPVNRLFGDLMREIPGLQPSYRPLLPRPGDPGAGGVELALLRDAGGARDGQEAEARWIARWIAEHCGPEGSGRPWRLGDVALLFRTTAPLTAYMDALKSARIPYLVESDRAFYGTPEVMDFLNLIRVVENPADRISLVGLLRSPMVLLEDRHLMALADNGMLDDRSPAPPSWPPDVQQRWRECQSLLARLRAAARRDTLAEFAERLLRETPILASSAAAYHGEQSVSNLRKLARLAADANAARGETLAGFVRRLTEAVNGGVEEGESPLGEEKVEAVRLLTVHKAKGLEYRVVFLPNLAAKVQGGQRRSPSIRQDWSEGRVGRRLVERKWADLAMAFLETDERRRETEEAVRLFYVAATRARDHLILVGNARYAPGSFMEMLAKASRPAEGNWELADGLRLPLTLVQRDEGPPPRWTAATPSGRRKGSAALARRWQAREAEAAAVQGQPLFWSPSTATPVESHKMADRSRPRFSMSKDAALLGRLCHAVLEEWPFGSSAELSPFLKRAVARLAPEHSQADWPALQSEAGEILSAFLQSPPARALSDGAILSREAPFLYGDGGRIVRGVIDLLYRRDGRLWVADYKTDQVPPGEGRLRAARYAAQGDAYRKAVRLALGEPAGFEVIFLRSGESVTIAPPA